jgi:secondary thiamine-phosphate synthase enzyme
MVFQKMLTFHTNRHGEIRDLTEDVAGVVRESGVRTGIVHIFNVGSTGALTTMEYEPGLKKDLPDLLDRVMPEKGPYFHEQTWHDGNGHSHLQASVVGPSLTVPVTPSGLALGTWQQIIHAECDVRPHHRKIVVTVYGE